MAEVFAIAISVAKPGFEEKLADALDALLAPTHKEKGILEYEMYRDMRESRCFVFIERWENEETFNAHCNAPHINVYLERTKGWVESNKIHVLRKGK